MSICHVALTSLTISRKSSKLALHTIHNLEADLYCYLCYSELLSETTGVVAHTLAREGDPLLPITRESTEKKAAEQKRKDKVGLRISVPVLHRYVS